MVTIYCLRDPKTYEIRYIGKTKDLKSRIRTHRWERQSSKFHTHKVNWLRKLGRDPIVNILEKVADEDWEEREIYWIKKMRKKGCLLTNICKGGQTSPVEGIGHSEKSKRKMRRAAIRNESCPPSRKGIVVTEETRQKLREASLKNGNRPPDRGGWNKGIRKAYCKNGHKFSKSNTRIRIRTNGWDYQVCKTCEKLAWERSNKKKVGITL